MHAHACNFYLFFFFFLVLEQLQIREQHAWKQNISTNQFFQKIINKKMLWCMVNERPVLSTPQRLDCLNVFSSVEGITLTWNKLTFRGFDVKKSKEKDFYSHDLHKCCMNTVLHISTHVCSSPRFPFLKLLFLQEITIKLKLCTTETSKHGWHCK